MRFAALVKGRSALVVVVVGRIFEIEDPAYVLRRRVPEPSVVAQGPRPGLLGVRDPDEVLGLRVPDRAVVELLAGHLGDESLPESLGLLVGGEDAVEADPRTAFDPIALTGEADLPAQTGVIAAIRDHDRFTGIVRQALGQHDMGIVFVGCIHGIFTFIRSSWLVRLTIGPLPLTLTDMVNDRESRH